MPEIQGNNLEYFSSQNDEGILGELYTDDTLHLPNPEVEEFEKLLQEDTILNATIIEGQTEQEKYYFNFSLNEELALDRIIRSTFANPERKSENCYTKSQGGYRTEILDVANVD